MHIADDHYYYDGPRWAPAKKVIDDEQPTMTWSRCAVIIKVAPEKQEIETLEKIDGLFNKAFNELN